MSKPNRIELPDGTLIPILYEDRAVLAIDKPAGWMLAPDSWDRTGRNLQLALISSVQGGDHWARTRNLCYIRFIHRLDADTSGLVLLGKSAGAVRAYGRLFESQRVSKTYLAVVQGIPARPKWVCRLKLGPEPGAIGRMRVDGRRGREAETEFQVIQTSGGKALIEARPLTGRTHQIRVHLAESGHPVLNDSLYGSLSGPSPSTARQRQSQGLALRAVSIRYPDPFQKREVRVEAPRGEFIRSFGFNPEAVPERKYARRGHAGATPGEG